MPELPEVETTVNDLKKKVLKRTFVDVWTDFAKIIKKPTLFQKFKKEIIGKKIEKIKRRGKNIIFEISGNKALLVHQKLTGHLLYGTWNIPALLRRRVEVGKNGKYVSKLHGPLEDKVNSYVHLLFLLDNGKMLALSDLRKFAKVELWDKDELSQSKEMKGLGPEPLEKSFTFGKFKAVLKNKKAANGEPRQRRGKIKQVLMDQSVIAGIGNIYSDEILFEAGINPFKKTQGLKEKELKFIYQATKKILRKAVELRGTSISDYRDIEGRSGFFEKHRKVYQREGEKCKKCGIIIKRVKIGGRSAHFCPQCQK